MGTAFVFSVLFSFMSSIVINRLFPGDGFNIILSSAILTVMSSISMPPRGANDNLSALHAQAAWSFLSVLGKTAVSLLVVGTFTSFLLAPRPFSLPSLLLWNRYLLLLSSSLFWNGLQAADMQKSSACSRHLSFAIYHITRNPPNHFRWIFGYHPYCTVASIRRFSRFARSSSSSQITIDFWEISKCGR